MSFNIRSFDIGSIFYQSGNGYPTHIATKGCTYINIDTGTMYINKDGIVDWGEILISSNVYYDSTNITISTNLTWENIYWGVNSLTKIDLILPSTTNKDGYFLIIKDEIGSCGDYRIRITPDSGLIDGNSYVEMNINYMSLTCMVRDGNWYLI
jgi:hypothetical protein